MLNNPLEATLTGAKNTLIRGSNATENPNGNPTDAFSAAMPAKLKIPQVPRPVSAPYGIARAARKAII
jgi:hypothetical protein